MKTVEGKGVHKNKVSEVNTSVNVLNLLNCQGGALAAEDELRPGTYTPIAKGIQHISVC